MTLRRALIAVHLLLLLIPLVTGALDLLIGSPLYAPELDPTQPSTLRLDNSLRYYGGYWFATAFVLLWLVRDLAQRDLPVRARQLEVFWGMVFVGGLSRVVGFVTFGLPPSEFFAYTALELLGAPLFALGLRRAWP